MPQTAEHYLTTNERAALLELARESAGLYMLRKRTGVVILVHEVDRLVRVGLAVCVERVYSLTDEGRAVAGRVG